MLSRLRQRYGLLGGELVQDRGGDVATNQAVAEAGIAFLERLAGNGRKRFGIGWGHIIGELVGRIEKRSQPVNLGESICPLIGNGGAGLKNYHSNELVRVVGEHSQSEPEFIYTPAYMTSEQDLKRTMDLENYHEILRSWRRLEVALVNIGNFPVRAGLCVQGAVRRSPGEGAGGGKDLKLFVGEDGHVLAVRDGLCGADSAGTARQGAACGGDLFGQYQPQGLGVRCDGYLGRELLPEHVVRDMLEQ